eukprot:Anaeramoba_ignava/a478257_7.p1 GENE.a478257_7~~a478257_7.p1  ORF type:complete len:328 (+),score=42.00 a478257_7:335-1318(+)
MRCPDFEVLISYIDNALSQKDKAIVKAHIDQCSVCQKEIAMMISEESEIKESFDALIKKKSVHSNIMTAIRNETVTAPAKKTFAIDLSFLRFKFALALTMIIAFGLLFMFKFSNKPKSYKGQVHLATYRALEKGAMVNNIACHLNDNNELKVGEKVNYRGKFEFSLPKKELTQVVWNGSGSFIFDKAYDIEFKAGDGYFVAPKGETVKIKLKDGQKLVTSKKLIINTKNQDSAPKERTEPVAIKENKIIKNESLKVNDINLLKKNNEKTSEIPFKAALTDSKQNEPEPLDEQEAEPGNVNADVIKAPNPFADDSIEIENVIIDTDVE